MDKRAPSTPIKFALGAAVMGVAFLLFLPFVGGGPKTTPLLGLVGILFVFTVAELLLSPVGLSVTTKLASEAFRTQMVALFFLSVALGTAISGQLAELYNPDTEGVYFGVLMPTRSRRADHQSQVRWMSSSWLPQGSAKYLHSIPPLGASVGISIGPASM